MSEQNSHTFTLAITPPPTDAGDASAAPPSPPVSAAEDASRSAGALLHLKLSVETLGQDIIRISAVDGRGRSYKGMLSLRPVTGDDLCYICDANGCHWVSPCPDDSGVSV
jgi:hypothetical protein